MKFTTLITALLATLTHLTLITAAPSAKPLHFKILAKRIGGHHPSFTNLYLTGTHTGAGENAPVFEKSAKDAPVFYLNGTRIMTKFGGKYPYGLALGGTPDYYAEWAPLTLNVGYGQKGFTIRENGTIVNENKDYGWKGWRICEWYHGQPELFWSTPYSSSKINPCNCEFVELIPKYV